MPNGIFVGVKPFIRTAVRVRCAVSAKQAAWAARVTDAPPASRLSTVRYRCHSRYRRIGTPAWSRGKLVDQLDGIRNPAALPGWLATTTRRECGRILRAAQGPHDAARAQGAEIPDHHAKAAEQELLMAERHAVAESHAAEKQRTRTPAPHPSEQCPLPP